MTLEKDLVSKQTLYNDVNNNKVFVSIDVKSANFRVLKHFCPSMFAGEWENFLSQFTESQFLLAAKYFREVVFGDLGNSKVGKYPIIFINDIFKHLITTPFMALLKKVHCSTDEIVFEINKPSTFPYDLFNQEINKVHVGYFHIRYFKLTQLRPKFFVKEYIFDKKIEFKNIPKKFMLQSIKFYEKEAINEIDRKFMDESGLVATFDKSIYE